MLKTPEQRQREMNRWYRTPHFVYTLCDPDSLAVRYVGCTHRPEDRIRQHCTKGGKPSPLRDWISSLRDANKRPVMMIVEKCKGPMEGAESERRVIAGYRKLLGQLLLNDGYRGQRPQFVVRDMCAEVA